MTQHARKVSRLKYGDTIGLFSPSDPITVNRKIRLIDSVRFLESKYSLKWGGHAFDIDFYQAGSRYDRLKDIIDLLSDENVKALLATWGGKNSNQLVKILPYSLFKKRRIPIIGFSDTCVILNPISIYADIITFYGPNIAGKILDSQHSDMSELSGKPYKPFGESAKRSWMSITPGSVEGILYGGNLGTFTIGLSGHECLRKMEDVVFFWENANESPQIIDQYLMGLENAGFFSSIKAMIVGQVSNERRSIQNRPINDLLYDYGYRHSIPIVKLDTFGHYNAENPPIPIGAHVALDTQRKILKLLQSVVE